MGTGGFATQTRDHDEDTLRSIGGLSTGTLPFWYTHESLTLVHFERVVAGIVRGEVNDLWSVSDISSSGLNVPLQKLY